MNQGITLWIFASFQRNYRNLPRYLRLMFSEEGILRDNAVPQPFPLSAFRDNRRGLVSFVADLDRNAWVCDKIVIPAWMLRSASVGGNDEQAVAIAYIHHWRCVRLAAFSACSCEQKQGSTRKRATRCQNTTRLPPLRTKIFY